MPNYITPNFRIKKAPLGAILSALQLGQQVGAMMPDNNAGNVLKGVFDPMSNIGAGIAYMAEGNIGKGLLSLVPGVGTYLQGKDQAEAEENAKRLKRANLYNNFLTTSKNASITDLTNYTPTNSVSMYPNGGIVPRVNLNSIPGNGGSLLLTNEKGGISGYHETGENIPIADSNGNTLAIAEPGEILTHNEDTDNAVIISKRNGLAKQFTALEQQKLPLLEKLDKAKTPEDKQGILRSIKFIDSELAKIKNLQEELVVNSQTPIADGGWVSNPNIPIPKADILKFRPDDSKWFYNDVDSDLNTLGYSNLNIPKPDMGMFEPAATDPAWNVPEADPSLFEKSTGVNWDNVSSTIGNVSQVASMLLPSITNYKNMKIMRDSLKEVNSHRPILNKVNYITPSYEIGDQVAAINNNFATMNMLSDRVANPLTASSILAGAGADRASQLNTAIGEKRRAEDNMRFKQSYMLNSINAQNNAILNADQQFKLETSLSLNNAKINLNNTTVDNIYAMLSERNLQESDRITLSMALKALNKYGVVDRKMSEELKKLGIVLSEDKVSD